VTRICLCGATGRMGSTVAKHLLLDEELEIVSAIAANDPNEGKDLGLFLGQRELGIKISDVKDLNSILDSSKPDLLVDFTQTEAAIKTAKIASEKKINLVIGTTGFNSQQLEELNKIIEDNKISAVIAPNMSVGVNIFFKVIKTLTEHLKDYDIEILELHHNKKRDAPSGTAKKAAEIIATSLGRDLNKSGVYGREGIIGERTKEEIGVHAIRAGDIVGEHTVYYAGFGERIEFTHKAHSRDCLAAGTVKAVKFLANNQNKSKVFGMADVLGL